MLSETQDYSGAMASSSANCAYSASVHNKTGILGAQGYDSTEK